MTRRLLLPFSWGKLKDELVLDEGRRRFPYKDTVGKLTIGVGRNLTDRGLDDEEIDFLLTRDIANHINPLILKRPWISELDDLRQRVLYNMAFNMGVDGLLQFKNTLAAVKRGDWEAAAAGMRGSAWYRQVQPSRSVRLAYNMRTGKDDSGWKTELRRLNRAGKVYWGLSKSLGKGVFLWSRPLSLSIPPHQSVSSSTPGSTKRSTPRSIRPSRKARPSRRLRSST